MQDDPLLLLCAKASTLDKGTGYLWDQLFSPVESRPCTWIKCPKVETKPREPRTLGEDTVEDE